MIELCRMREATSTQSGDAAYQLGYGKSVRRFQSGLSVSSSSFSDPVHIRSFGGSSGFAGRRWRPGGAGGGGTGATSGDAGGEFGGLH